MFENPTTEAEAIRELVKSAAFVNDELKRGLLVRSIARKFNLREKLLETELNKYLEQNSKEQDRPKAVHKQKMENQLLKLLSESDKRIYSSRERINRTYSLKGMRKLSEIYSIQYMPEDFTNKSLGTLAKVVHDSYLEGNYNTASLVEKIEDEKLKNYVLSITLGEHQISTTWDKRSSSGKIAKDPVKYSLDTIRKYPAFEN